MQIQGESDLAAYSLPTWTVELVEVLLRNPNNDTYLVVSHHPLMQVISRTLRLLSSPAPAHVDRADYLLPLKPRIHL